MLNVEYGVYGLDKEVIIPPWPRTPGTRA